MNFDLTSNMFGKLAEKLAGQLPNLSEINGYEFKDGTFKAGVEYAMLVGDIEYKDGFVVLRAAANVNLNCVAPVYVPTTLALTIKPPSIAFLYFLKENTITVVNPCIIMPNGKQVVDFIMISAVDPPVRTISQGDIIGYGIFIPIVPINNIVFTKQDAP
jgi:hypothetical protein